MLEQDPVAGEQFPGVADGFAHAHGAERLGQGGVLVAGLARGLQLGPAAASGAGAMASRQLRGLPVAICAVPRLTSLPRALATASADRVSTLPIWCGVKAVSGNLRRCSSTRSRSAPGRVAGARRPLAVAFSTRRPWAACSRTAGQTSAWVSLLTWSPGSPPGAHITCALGNLVRSAACGLPVHDSLPGHW